MHSWSADVPRFLTYKCLWRGNVVSDTISVLPRFQSLYGPPQTSPTPDPGAGGGEGEEQEEEGEEEEEEEEEGEEDSALCTDNNIDAMMTVTVRRRWGRRRRGRTQDDAKTYVFKGDNYWQLTDTGVAKDYPKKIAEKSDELPADLDAALVHAPSSIARETSFLFKVPTSVYVK